jgi:hypothetical protein
MTAREALAQEWRERLEDFADSEMTVAAWCDFNHVSACQYYYWRRRLNADKAEEQVKGSWMALSVVDTPPASAAPAGLTIRIAGATIEVTPNFDPAMLRAVVNALATKPC